MICTFCGEAGTIQGRYSDACQFCWDCLHHELKLTLDAIRDFGQYHHGNRGPRFYAIYWTGTVTLGYGLYLPHFPHEAMGEALRTGARNNWRLLRVDIQKTLTDIYISEDYSKYMVYSHLKPLLYDVEKYGRIA